jgi:hypothetical protein
MKHPTRALSLAAFTTHTTTRERHKQPLTLAPTMGGLLAVFGAVGSSFVPRASPLVQMARHALGHVISKVKYDTDFSCITSPGDVTPLGLFHE